jgi:4-hydroxy-tetrahydrodipicolinate synthase
MMKLTGVIPALVTPFDEAGKVDFKKFEKLLTKLRQDGVKGWVPCGSTGEYNAMTGDERAAVLKFVAGFATKNELLIAGTNAGSTWEVIEHTKRARDLGYSTVLLSAPFYATPAQDELIAHYQAVLDAVDVDIIVYNYPPKVGVEIGMTVLEAFVDNPRVIGLKESSGNLLRAVELRSRFGDRYQLTNGSDDQTLDFYLWGATSWICGPANCMAKACVDLVNTIEAGDWLKARDKMQVLYRAMSSLESGKFVQKVKYGCELAGTPVGVGRQPLLPLNAEEKAAFKKAMEPVLG